MTTDALQTIAGYLALAVPATVAIANIAKAFLEWLQQRHKILESQIQLSHSITTHYLDKALDPTVPLAIRHQLLRFLATPDIDGTRLSGWAKAELERVGGLVDETNRAVSEAEAGLRAAKSATELERAERMLAEAVRKQQGLLQPPITPPVTAAAIRAGLVTEKKLSGLQMPGANLQDADFVYRELRGADFAGANLARARLQGCDLRAATFEGADLTEARFPMADLRGASLRNATLESTSFSQARLEGADFTGSDLSRADLRATYDESTIWPEGFDPVAAGAVHVHPNASQPDTPTPPTGA